MKTYDGTVRRWIAWIAPLTLLALAAVAAAEDPRWVQARTLETQERWAEAGEMYALPRPPGVSDMIAILGDWKIPPPFAREPGLASDAVR